MRVFAFCRQIEGKVVENIRVTIYNLYNCAETGISGGAAMRKQEFGYVIIIIVVSAVYCRRNFYRFKNSEAGPGVSVDWQASDGGSRSSDFYHGSQNRCRRERDVYKRQHLYKAILSAKLFLTLKRNFEDLSGFFLWSQIAENSPVRNCFFGSSSHQSIQSSVLV